MIPLPTELVTAKARGSMRQWVPFMTKRYSSPGRAPATSADQLPLPSGASGCAVALQPLNVPATLTDVAQGAHTLNVVASPPGSGRAPIPGRADGLGIDASVVEIQSASRFVK